MTLPVRRHVLVDVDGVLADFDRGFLHLWRTAHPDRPWLAPAARRHFYLREDYPPAWRDAVQAVIDAPGFYRQLPVMAGAQAALAALATRGYRLTVCTSPGATLAERHAWLAEHFGPALAQGMLACADKTQVDGDWLIDDNPAPSGACAPRWRHIVFDQPYNRHAPGLRLNWQNWAQHWPESG